ncbi:hypothetical protein TWF132_005151 [Orbilia oligospora]|nr:hypothetical protein TWF751_010234 [Orbilia oligospora]KAF3230732.1 hypothetical protein TWF128_005291 [Orbilia oligospora]KAF3273467.1 hypothetical protein TWF132_005151 [Orbilia oligospora]
MPDAPLTSQNVFSNQLSESEPLLGRAGAVRQREDAPFWKNLFLGTGFLAQIGLLVLLITVWISIFSLPLGLFTLHPLFNSVRAALGVIITELHCNLTHSNISS